VGTHRRVARSSHDSEGKGSALGNANLGMFPSKKEEKAAMAAAPNTQVLAHPYEGTCRSSSPGLVSSEQPKAAGAGLPRSSQTHPSFPKTPVGPLHLIPIPFSNPRCPARAPPARRWSPRSPRKSPTAGLRPDRAAQTLKSGVGKLSRAGPRDARIISPARDGESFGRREGKAGNHLCNPKVK